MANLIDSIKSIPSYGSIQDIRDGVDSTKVILDSNTIWTKDTSGPQINITSKAGDQIFGNGTDYYAQYDFSADVSDPSGIKYITLFRGGTVVDYFDGSLNGYPTSYTYKQKPWSDLNKQETYELRAEDRAGNISYKEIKVTRRRYEIYKVTDFGEASRQYHVRMYDQPFKSYSLSTNVDIVLSVRFLALNDGRTYWLPGGFVGRQDDQGGRSRSYSVTVDNVDRFTFDFSPGVASRHLPPEQELAAFTINGQTVYFASDFRANSTIKHSN